MISYGGEISSMIYSESELSMLIVTTSDNINMNEHYIQNYDESVGSNAVQSRTFITFIFILYNSESFLSKGLKPITHDWCLVTTLNLLVNDDSIQFRWHDNDTLGAVQN